MKSCSDGYPGCRVAEATGKWCAGACPQATKELASLLEKRSAMQEAHMAKWHNGSCTRAQTTTHSARVSHLNERIVFLRAEIKSATGAEA